MKRLLLSVGQFNNAGSSYRFQLPHWNESIFHLTGYSTGLVVLLDIGSQHEIYSFNLKSDITCFGWTQNSKEIEDHSNGDSPFVSGFWTRWEIQWDWYWNELFSRVRTKRTSHNCPALILYHPVHENPTTCPPNRIPSEFWTCWWSVWRPVLYTHSFLVFYHAVKLTLLHR